MFLTSVILTWSRFKPCFLLDNVTYGFVTDSPVPLAPSGTSSYLSIGSLSLSSLLPFFDFICSSFPDLSQNVSMFRQTESFWLISSICASRSLKGEGGGQKERGFKRKSKPFLLHRSFCYLFLVMKLFGCTKLLTRSQSFRPYQGEFQNFT